MATFAVRPRERRSFLTRVAAGAAAFGTLFRGQPAYAQSEARSATAGAGKPTRYTQDDWLDEIKGAHRLLIDTTSPQGLGSALSYGNNYFVASQDGYGLGNSDLALVIVVRHNSTPFAYSDAMWEKYGTPIGEAAGDFNDPKTKARPAINVYNSSTHLGLLPNNATLDALTQRGVHFAVCQMATRRIARAIAAARGLNVDTVYNELASNLIRNSHMVPAGIVTVNRAQERGYSFANAG
jgi:intracellular sulfur oxidation DsrE/DsrF family protein